MDNIENKVAEKQDAKRLGAVKKVFKWLFITPLAFLLIVAIIFQAPWKVTALLLILLLACTVMPGPARKWFWLSVGVVVIVLIIWVFLPDEGGDWRPYTFDKELAEIEAKRAVTPEQNAATIYNQLLYNHDPYSFYPDFWDWKLDDLTLSEPWSSKDHPQPAKWLKGRRSTIAILLEAARKKKCRFPIAVGPAGLGQVMYRLAPMRRWAVLLIRAANNDLGDGRLEQALEKNLAVLQMAKHGYQQPLMFEFLAAMAVEAIALKNVNTFIVEGQPTSEHLGLIEDSFAGVERNWKSDLPKILACEKLRTKNMLCSLAYEINPKGKVRLRRNQLAAMRAQFWKMTTPQTYWQRKLSKASTILAWFLMPSTPQKAAKIIDAAYEELYAAPNPSFDRKRARRGLSIIPVTFNYRCLIEHMVAMSEQVIGTFHHVYLRTMADRKGSRLIIVLRRYKNKNGNWPASLDDIQSLAPPEVLVDPINKSDFVYKLTEENFTLYSKGRNNIDEDGRYGPQPGQTIIPDDWLIWPRPNRR